VIVATMLPRTDCTGSCETERVAYNTLVTGGATANGYTVDDLAADSRLQNPNDTTYFAADKIHLNDSGYGVVASDAAAVITPKLAANNNFDPRAYKL
jgi:lysophospholipase L1-like esterase